MMIIFHFILIFLRNSILKVGLSIIFKNVYTCTKCPILQNGLHVDEIIYINSVSLCVCDGGFEGWGKGETLKPILVLIKLFPRTRGLKKF